MADLVRLVLLILFLPIILIFIGPLLILAVIRGYQPMGPITLDTSRYSTAGRVGALALGILLWLVVWGGLAWFTLYAFAPPVVITSAPTTVPTPVTPQDTPTSTPVQPTSTLVHLVELTTLPPTATPATGLETATPPPSTSTPAVSMTPMTATLTPSSTRETPSVITPTAPPATATIGASVTVTRTVEPTGGGGSEGTRTPVASPQATLTFVEREAVIEVVKAGNVALQETISEADEDNLQSLETIWQGLALQVVQKVATQIYGQYAKPVVVEFEYLEPPTVDRQSTYSQVTVTSRERWAYGGPSEIDREELFDFIYTLTKADETWIISRYTYRNVPVSDLTPTPTLIPSPTLTSTSTITSTPANPEGG